MSKSIKTAKYNDKDFTNFAYLAGALEGGLACMKNDLAKIKKMNTDQFGEYLNEVRRDAVRRERAFTVELNEAE